jgi:uncharacterized protein YbjT (DUF2867 family)
MTDRLLVTGATGTVGEPLVRELSDGDASVRVATRSPDSAREMFGDVSEYVEFDLGRPETWRTALADIDRLLLLYPPGSAVSDVTEFADAADRVGVEHVAFLSILGVEKLPVLPHRRIETHLAGTGMAHTFLRASWFAQNLSEIHRPKIVDRDERFVPAGDGVVSFTDARDVAAVGAAVLTDSQVRELVGEGLGVVEESLRRADRLRVLPPDELDERVEPGGPVEIQFDDRLPEALVAFHLG